MGTPPPLNGEKDMACSRASAEVKTSRAVAEEVAAKVNGGTPSMSSKAVRMWSNGHSTGEAMTA
jgi:hypothetical protein